MKITVELPDSEIEEICRLTGESKKGPAIRKLVLDSLMMKRRRAIAEKFISGQWSAELPGFEESRLSDRAAAKSRTSRRRS